MPSIQGHKVGSRRDVTPLNKDLKITKRKSNTKSSARNFSEVKNGAARHNSPHNSSNDEVQYEPVRIQQTNLDEGSDYENAFITQPKTATAGHKHLKAKSIFVNETLQSASKTKLKVVSSSRDQSREHQSRILEPNRPKLLADSLMMDSCHTQDLSYRKRQIITEDQIPPKLIADSSNFRPSNKNYAKFLKELEQFEQKYGKRMSQSLGVITYETQRNKSSRRYHDQNRKNDVVSMPRYLKLSNNKHQNSAYEVKIRILMSKYIHDQFDPSMENEIAKAYYEGVENISSGEDQNISALIWKLGKYKGRIKPPVRQSNFA